MLFGSWLFASCGPASQIDKVSEKKTKAKGSVNQLVALSRLFPFPTVKAGGGCCGLHTRQARARGVFLPWWFGWLGCCCYMLIGVDRVDRGASQVRGASY